MSILDRAAHGVMGILLTATLVVVFAVTIILMFLQAAEAASFLCKMAATPQERSICTDLTLSRADEKLTAAYKATLGRLSKPGREALREGQRDWLRYIATVCRIVPKDDAAPDAECLKREYSARQKQLDNAVVEKGGLVIRRVDIFRATPAVGAGSGGGHPGFNTTVIAFPQIDSPRDKREKGWNKVIAEHSHGGQTLAGAFVSASTDPDDDHDLWVDYTLGSVSSEMISLRLLIQDDWHGAHGSASDEHITSLIRERRMLRAGDIFDTHHAWSEALARLVFDAVKRNANKDGDEPFWESPEMADAVSDPAHWLITDHELIIHFDVPTFPHLVEAAIPWRELKKYLRSPLPFPISSD
jgi:uncharacterized protein